jgi:hypothetical protein
MNKYNETLMKFISTQNQKIRQDVSRQGYKDNSPYKNNPFNVIEGTEQGTPITMDGVSKRLRVTDNMGNSEILEPNSGEHFFPGSQVREEEIPLAQFAGQTKRDSVAHQADKILKYEQLRGGPGGIPLPGYSNPAYMSMLMNSIYPQVQRIMPNASAMETGEAMDFVFNAGWDKDNNKITKDPRAFALQEYYRQYDPSKLDTDGKWSGRKNAPYSFDQEYSATIGKLSENQRRLLMNKGRDWYYKNINNPSPGVPSSDYNDTWYGRIWNTNDYKPFNPNNPKFTPKKQQGGIMMRDSDCETCNQLQKYQFAGLAPNDQKRKEYAAKVVEEAERRVRENDYITPDEVPQNVREASAREGKLPYTCVGGACDVYKTAGVLDNINWSNTDFALNAKEYGFTANQGWGLKGIDNLEPGDMIQYKQVANEQGKYYPSHTRIFLGIDANGKYRFFDNYAQQEQLSDKSEIEYWLDPNRKDTEPNAVVFKVNPYSGDNPYNLTPEEKEVYDDKQRMIKSDSSSPQEYDWRISKNAKNYNPDTKRVMDKFISFANDNDKINELVRKTGKSKEDIQDSLLNVFGELGVENNWTTSKGKRLGSKLENVAESVLTAFGGGKKYSVGPGQIKYNSLSEDLKQKYNITSPNDLYDVDKVLPLMTAMDLLDKQALTNWGKNNTLERKLFGVENYESPFTVGDLPARNNSDSVLDEGIGRYSPYLRNQYSSIASGTMLEGGNDYIPFNERVVPNYVPSEYYNQPGTMKRRYERDPGSYPYLVEQNWRNNLERDWIPNNSDQPVELQEVTVKPQFQKGGTYDPLSRFNSFSFDKPVQKKNTTNAIELALLINNQASLFNTTDNWLDNL